MSKQSIIQESRRKIINILTFVDLPVRQKFFLFSAGVLFWLVVTAGIGFVIMFEMNAKSNEMVNQIWPQEKTANIVIRKLRGSNISIHNMVIDRNESAINANYRRVKATLGDAVSYLNTLLNGGQVTDYMRATGQISESYRVLPVTEPDNRQIIEEAINKIKELEKIGDVIAGGDHNAKLAEAITEYDLITRDTVTILNDYAITVGGKWRLFTDSIKKRFNLAIIAISVTFSIAFVLSIIFGMLISRSFERPIKALINQIRALSAGDIDLTKKINVASKDELGLLSNEFNKLMETIAHLTSFKTVIEEDDSIEDVYVRLGKIFRSELGLTSTVIYEVSHSKNTMKVVYPLEAEGTELFCDRETQLDANLCRAKRTGHKVSSIDYPDVCKYYTTGPGASHVCIPIIVGGNVGGIVQVNCETAEARDTTDLEHKTSRVQQYITEAQPVLEAKRLMRTLKDSSFKDVMTGLYNRRFLDESFENIIGGVLRRKTVLGLLMCDLDYFKQTNDQYGHDAGDTVLKETSNIIRGSVRSSDLVIRFGGEEFLVLLIDAKPEDSINVAEKIRENIEAAKIQIPGGSVQKTISVGTSEFPSDTPNFWEAVKYADVALYKAKESGRNKALRFTVDMWTGDKY